MRTGSFKGVLLSTLVVVSLMVLTLSFSSTGPASTLSDNLTPHYVYLTWASPDTAHTINVSWRTDENYVGEVRYDTEPRNGAPGAYNYSVGGTGGVTTAKFEGYIHHVELTGLEPDTIYYFICGGENEGWSEELSFRTAPVEKGDIRFVVGGDSRSGGNWPEARDSVSQLMASYDPDFVIFSGDFLYNGETQPGGDTWDNWLGAVYEYWRTEDGRLIPMIPVIGNHELVYPQPSDYDPEEDASNYYMLFNLPENERWYSLNWGPDLHITILDSEIRSTGSASWSKQLGWLGQDLLEHRNNLWKIVTAHRPAFSSGHHGCDYNIQEYWVPEFDLYHVDLYFNGHDHDYERTHPINYTISENTPMQSPENGTIYVTSGGWGAPLYGGSLSWWTAYGPDSRYHFILVDIYENGENGTLYMRAIDIDDNTFDENYIQKETGLDLVAGWNLVGFTGVSENDNLGNIFTGLTYYDNYYLYYWNAPGGPYGVDLGPDDFPEDNLGYWAWINQDTKVGTTGTPPENRKIHLVAGWNLVSFPVVSGTTTIGSVFTGLTYYDNYYLYYWNPPGGPYGVDLDDTSFLEDNLGYWVWIDQNKTVTVP